MNIKYMFLLSVCCGAYVLNSMEKEKEIKTEVVQEKKVEIPNHSVPDIDLFFSADKDERSCNWCIEFCFPSDPMKFLKDFYQYRTVHD